MRDSLSLELHVPADCPPIFISNCLDDRVVHPMNSELLEQALSARGINHLYIRFTTGGHGFGVMENARTEECRLWKYNFLSWVEQFNN